MVNRELLDWLSRRARPERPFFAFLNYFDAHYPYQLPPGRLHRFGVEPTDNYQRILIQHWWELDKTTLSPEGVAFAADAYDDCIADLDEQLGKLVDELDRRGVLERTWLIITSDHGESFGEHAGVFCHGTSLYETELHVPLLIIPPGGSVPKRWPSRRRSACATWRRRSSTWPVWRPARHFPAVRWHGSGGSLGQVASIRSPSALSGARRGGSRRAAATAIPGSVPKPGSLRWEPSRMNDWSYIRREGDVHEELFHLREDPKEQHNLAGDPVRPEDPRADASRPGPPDRWAALARALQSLTIEHYRPYVSIAGAAGRSGRILDMLRQAGSEVAGGGSEANGYPARLDRSSGSDFKRYSSSTPSAARM